MVAEEKREDEQVLTICQWLQLSTEPYLRHRSIARGWRIVLQKNIYENEPENE